ncbi:hypothetical protein HCQ94_02655 [Actinomyces sp. zg-332]|uniref:primosomal protein N' family DNA-binding protein n=1 Tax=Actinomyces sp. zg-332 TaxID=2708340 RepID=UPI001421ABA7|nr:hypothetical protein [Actinomyces sp. zg-332]QPK94617.1 hypothetical protein HCQ94_02655 [Actinomyces sp. zg-332]
MFDKETNNLSADTMVSHTLFDYAQNKSKLKKYVVKVLLDLPMPHMDRLFDYEVPSDNVNSIAFGIPVTVPFSNRNLQGWIIEHGYTYDYPEKLLQIKSVDSKYSLLTPEIYELAKKTAQLYLTNTSEIVKIAVQNRQIRVEKKFAPDLSDCEVNVDDIPKEAITQYINGEVLLKNLENSLPVKATITLRSYYGTDLLNWVYSILLPTFITLKTNKQVIILLPTKKQSDLVHSFLKKYISDKNIATIYSEDTGSVKYTNFLKVLTGQARVILGTQNAVFAPARDLGLIICFDDANLNYQSQKSPYINIRQVAIQRSINEKLALILAGFNKSIYMRQLENLKWAIPLEITPQHARMIAPKIVCTQLLDNIEPYHRISSYSYETIKNALEKGPVLVQVGTRGYFSKVVCKKCSLVPVCSKCKHLVSMQNDNLFTCINCGKIYDHYQCSKCKNDDFKAIRSGDNKTMHDLGKMFPSVPILLSNATTPITDYIDDRSRIIVATPGAEPIPINGYAASIILDIETIYELPTFWAQTESFRRWYNIVGLTRQNGTVVIDGNIENNVAINLQTWNTNKILDEILTERKELQLPPHSKFISLFGNHQQITDCIKHIEDNGFETIGVISKPNNQALTICKSSIAESKNLLNLLKEYIAYRSLKKLPRIRTQVDPIQLW